MTETPVQVLGPEEAWELLGSGEVGRLATCVGGVPDVYPVNYHAADGKIILRTGEGTKLSELAVNDRVAFETDSYTDDGGWSGFPPPAESGATGGADGPAAAGGAPTRVSTTSISVSGSTTPFTTS